MRVLKASLTRLSQSLPKGDIVRAMFASMAREAGIQEDWLARAYFIEGLLGYTPGFLARNARAQLKELQDALETGGSNQVLDRLRHERMMDDKEIWKLIGDRDMDLFGALEAGAAQGMPREGVRGLLPEDVAMSIAAGISPLTGKSLRYGPGGNVFHHIGGKWRGKFSMGGLAKLLRAEAKNRAMDITRGTSSDEMDAMSIYTPTGDDERSMLVDILEENDKDTRADYVDLINTVFNDSGIMNIVDREVRKSLTGPVQEALWTALARDPDLIIVKPNKVGVNARELAQAAAKIMGREYSGKGADVVARRLFDEKIWPALQIALTESAVTKSLLTNRHVMEIIQESIRSRPHHTRTRGIGIHDADPQFHAPKQWWRQASERVAARFMGKK